jgi:hypothetical protein
MRMTRDGFVERIESFVRIHAPEHGAEARLLALELWTEVSLPTAIIDLTEVDERRVARRDGARVA